MRNSARIKRLDQSSLLTGLVSYWKLDGTSRDSGKSGNHGTDTAITYATANGKVNQGALFNGTSSVISVADNPTLEMGSAFTCSFWFKRASGAKILVGKYNDSGGTAHQASWLISVWTDNKIYINTNATGIGTADALKTSSSTTTDTGWNHLVGRYAGSPALLDLYLNAAPVAATLSGSIPASIYDGTAAFEIGRYQGGTQYSTGSIDEVGLWNRVLSPAEVLKLYNNGAGNSHPFRT